MPTIRLIVLNAIERHSRNAAWELFSTRQDRIRHGAACYRPRRAGTWDLLYQLYLMHILEDPSMAKTMDEYIRETRLQFLRGLTPQEWQVVLDQLPPEEVIKHLPPEEVIKHLPPEERLRGLKPEERLRGLKPEELRQLQEYLKTSH